MPSAHPIPAPPAGLPDLRALLDHIDRLAADNLRLRQENAQLQSERDAYLAHWEAAQASKYHSTPPPGKVAASPAFFAPRENAGDAPAGASAVHWEAAQQARTATPGAPLMPAG